MRLRGEGGAGRTVGHDALMVRVAHRRTGLTVDTCRATRLLVPGFLIGVFVSSVSGSDAVGWAAAALTVGVLLAVQRMRHTGASCAIEPPQVPSRPAARPTDAATDTSSSG